MAVFYHARNVRWNGQIRRAAVLAALVLLALAPAAMAGPRNIIVLIGDGMGPEQVRAAGMFRYGKPGTLLFESFPHHGESITTPAMGADADPAKPPVTDSAAGATALATGHKVFNGTISVANPGDGQPLETILERLARQGKATGLVTTTYIEHATPAAFGAHQGSRGSLASIAHDYLSGSRPNVLFGGVSPPNRDTGERAMTPEAARAAGYTVVTTREELRALNPKTVTHVSGQFCVDMLPYEVAYARGQTDGYDRIPHLAELTREALAILSQDPDGFFLMVEGGRIDHAGHGNDLAANVMETLAFDDAVAAVYAWAAGRDDTLIVVTADHETGGLHVVKSSGWGQLPEVTWTSGDHSGANVPVYAWGAGSDRFDGTMQNTEIYHRMLADPQPSHAEGSEVEAAEPVGAAHGG